MGDCLDMFNRNIFLGEVDIVMGTRLVVSVIADEKHIHFRFYTSRLLPSDLKKGQWSQDESLVEIGPRITTQIMRVNIADDALYKRSVKYKPYWAEKTVSLLGLHETYLRRRKILRGVVLVTRWEESTSSSLTWTIFKSERTKSS